MKWPLFRSAPRPVVRETRPLEPQPRFHAVEILSAPDACPQAKQLREMRFLSNEDPPVLPLAGCDRAQHCTCRYRHHADRRRDQRRSSDRVWDSAAPRASSSERRYLIGRRVTDWSDDRR